MGKNGDFSHIHIEVKTTISKGKVNSQNFHMTPNEWSAASTYKNLYFIYRLMISSSNISLFIIQDPVGSYKKDVLQMMLTKNGADVKYNNHSGIWEDLLI